MTDDHLLTDDGLHWSDQTTTELITGEERGHINDAETFGVQNTPVTPVTAYRIENGDSGRITFVGKTKSGIALDLIWTVLDSDREDWVSHSGYAGNSRVKGLGFAGEQSIPGAKGNAIAVLYNEASRLSLRYQLVKHGTTDEQPVLLSFISTDIDAAQGVETDLANLAEVIPPDANLVKKDGIIYDKTPGVVGLNGSGDLPRGGYLGAGFLSRFDYTFYSPAPERANDSYAYPIAVRYDIFGSSLQAKLDTRHTRRVTVTYADREGQLLKPVEHYRGFMDETYKVSSVVIPRHRLVDVKRINKPEGHVAIQFIYERDYRLRFDFVDESGKALHPSRELIGPKGQNFKVTGPVIAGYTNNDIVQGIITKDQLYRLVYRQVVSASSVGVSSSRFPQGNVIEMRRDSSILSKEKEELEENLPMMSQTIPWQVSRPTSILQAPSARVDQVVNRQQLKRSQSTANQSTDWIQKNTGLSKDEQETFFSYLKEVRQLAAKKADAKNLKGQKRLDHINHAIANAIAGTVYAGDKKQYLINDFNPLEYENLKGYSKFKDLIYETGQNSVGYKIDLAHLAAPLASSYDSVWWKEAIKGIASIHVGRVKPGLSAPAPYPSYKDIYFWLNSYTGDKLSVFGGNDLASDQDAWILYNRYKTSPLTLDERLKHYYGQALQRKKDLAQAAAQFPAGKKTLIKLDQVATASLGGLAVWLALRKRGKKEKGSPLGRYHFNPLTALKDEPRPSSPPEKSYHFNPVHSLQTSPPLPSKPPLSSPLIDPAINERVKVLNQKRDIRPHQSKQKAPLPSVKPMTTKPSVQPMRSYHFNPLTALQEAPRVTAPAPKKGAAASYPKAGLSVSRAGASTANMGSYHFNPVHSLQSPSPSKSHSVVNRPAASRPTKASKSKPSKQKKRR